MLDKRLLTGGMDSDTDPRFIENGDYLYALNIRASKTGQQALGAVENIQSTTVVPYILPTGANQVIGRFFDKRDNVGYYFVYNDSNNHSILKYDPKLSFITKVIENSLLNFSPDYPILHIDIVEGMLFWTDGFNEPSYINIENASNNVYTYSTRQYFDAIQYRPAFAPEYFYFRDDDYRKNNVYGNIFQFAYSYVYDDNQESALSPTSNLPQYESVSLNAPYIDPAGTFLGNDLNIININVNTGIDRVKKLNLYVRRNNIGDWYLAETIDKSELGLSNGAIYTYTFYNDKLPSAADQRFCSRLYDYIPLTAECQSVIDGKRITYSNIKEGYDNIPVDISVSPVYSYTGTETYKPYPNFILQTPGGPVNFGLVNLPLFDVPGTPIQSLVYKTLKRNARHSVGFIYYDEAGRSSLVQTSSTCDFYVDGYDQTAGNIVPVSLNIDINHTPPSWAKKWQLAYTGNTTISKFIQVKAVSVTPISGVYNIVISDTGTGVEQGFALFNKNNNNKTSLNYEWSKGDRVRFLTSGYDFEINNDGTFLDTYFISIDDAGFVPVAGEMMEIYTLRLAPQDNIYYETGYIFDVLNGFHLSNIQNQSAGQPAKLNCWIGDTYFLFRSQSPYGAFVESFSASDYFTSNYWAKGRPNVADKTYRQITRPTTVYYSEPYIPETTLNGLSTVYDTSFESYDIGFGGIKKTYAEDERLFLFQQIKTAFVVVSRNILYNADGTPNGVVGQENAVLSQANYYAGNYGIGNNPESFAVYGNRKYHVDVQNGVVLRLSIDGYTPISEFKMHNYFTNTCRSLLNDFWSFKVWGEYDFRHDEYVLTFSRVTRNQTTIINRDGNNEIVFTFTKSFENIAFSEDKKRWVTFYSYRPDCMMMTSSGLSYFEDGKMLMTASGSDYNKFNGVSYPSQVRVCSNLEPLAKKFFHGVVVDSNVVWSMPSATDLLASQETELSAADFDDKEGVYYAALLRDKNTPNISNPLFEGDIMRDYVLIATFENNSNDYVRLISLGVRSGVSQITMQ